MSYAQGLFVIYLGTESRHHVQKLYERHLSGVSGNKYIQHTFSERVLLHYYLHGG